MLNIDEKLKIYKTTSMQFPLNQFEQFIDETILNRGLTYFKRGYVHNVEELSGGEYEAIVEGSDNYSVQLKVENDTVVEYVCSCPYDLGPVCKHVVAVLFYLQQGMLDIKAKIIPLPKPPTRLANKSSKKKTVADQIDEILQKISGEEIKDFIKSKAQKEVAFQREFLTTFAHQNSNESKAFYSKQIRAILQKASGRQKFIPWNKTGPVGKQVFELVTTAQKHLANGNVTSAIYIATAVLEEMTKALDCADDSNGDIGGPITYSYELLQTIAIENISEEIRKSLYDYCILSFKKEVFSGWDWHIGVLEIAVWLCNSDAEAKSILNCLNEGTFSQYEKERTDVIKLSIIRKTKGDAEAEKFIEQHLSNSDMRNEAIKKAIHDQLYEKAITLARDGIEQDKKNKPGLVKDWYNWLLKIAQVQNDVPNIIKYARFLYVDNFSHEQDYFELLKCNVHSDKWNDFVEELIKSLRSNGRWTSMDQVAKIFINEEWWQRLLELLKEYKSLSYIESMEKYLAKDYSADLVLLYKEWISDYMINNVGRNHYITACKYLRRMIKLGGRATADKLIADFRIQYSNRIALMEELDRV